MFTRSHSKEESSDGDVSNVCMQGVGRDGSISTGESVECPQELRCDGFLPVGRWVQLVKGCEQGSDRLD